MPAPLCGLCKRGWSQQHQSTSLASAASSWVLPRPRCMLNASPVLPPWRPGPKHCSRGLQGLRTAVSSVDRGPAEVASQAVLPAVRSAAQIDADSSSQLNLATGHTSVAALATPVTYNSKWPLLIPGMLLGALVTLAWQKIWSWLSRMTLVRHIMETLDMKRDASSQTQGFLDSADEDKEGSISIPLPDSPELRRALSSLSSTSATDMGESVEWVNMCWRKAWRVYQRGLERWIQDLLQPVFDGVVRDGSVPRFVQRLRIVELTLDHEAPYFSNMRRRYSRKDSDLTGVVDLRYTGGVRMLLMLEIGGGRWRFKVPVLVSDLDLECQMWIKIRLAPMCPWIGTLSLAFVGPPNVKVQLSPYNRVRLMRVPVVQNFLRKLLTVDLPGLMVLPKRLEVAIPPSVTSVAEAAVGRDTIMRAVASAVLQADALENALLAALPLGPQTPAGGVSLPEAFRGELDVVLREARDLPVWGFPGQSNPYVRLVLGKQVRQQQLSWGDEGGNRPAALIPTQAVQSRRDDDTSSPGRHKHPVWNQEFQFLVEAPESQMLEIEVRDSHLTGRVEVGSASLSLSELVSKGGRTSIWLPLIPPPAYASRAFSNDKLTFGEVFLEVTYKPFDEEYDDQDSGYREAAAFQQAVRQMSGGEASEEEHITDIRSAAAASSRAAVAASAAISAIAMTKAAAARAATRAARAAQAAAVQAVAGIPKATSPPPALPPGTYDGSTPVQGAGNLLGEDIPLDIQASSDTDEYEDGMGRGVTTIPELSGSQDVEAGAAGAAGGADDDLATSTRFSQTQGAAGERAGNGSGPLKPTSLTGLQHTQHTAGFPVRDHVPLYGSSNGKSSHGRYQGNASSQAGGDAGSASSSSSPSSESSWQPSSSGAGVAGSAESVETVTARQYTSAVSQAVVTQVLEPPGQLSEAAGSGQQALTVQADVVLLADSVVTVQEAGNGTSEAGSQQGTGSTGQQGDGVAGTPTSSSSSSDQAAVQTAQHLPLPLVLNRVHDLGMALGSVLGHARDSLGASSKPSSSTTDASARKEGSDAAEADAKSSNNTSWLGPLFAALSVLTSSTPPATPSGSKATDSLDAADKSADKASLDQGDAKPHGKQWWEFWVSDVTPEEAAAKQAAAAAAAAVAAQEKAKAEEAGKGSKPWWAFWEQDKSSGGEGGEDGRAGDASRDPSKPVEAIIIPPDLPLEEIAREVAKLKDENWRSKGERVETLWARAVEKNDRPWIMLCAALLAVACALLAAVAWRLDHVSEVTPPDGDLTVPLATLQLMLQMLTPK